MPRRLSSFMKHVALPQAVSRAAANVRARLQRVKDNLTDEECDRIYGISRKRAQLVRRVRLVGELLVQAPDRDKRRP